MKFDIIYRDILHRPLAPLERDQLGRRFTELVVAGVLACPFVPGALEFLKAHAAQVPLFLASGTPEDELRHILEGRGLSHYFREACGSPRGKSQIVRDILRRGGWGPAGVPFVGDAVNDYHAAAEVGLPFIGRVAPGAANPFPASVPIVPDLTTLAKFWPELSARTV
jgi:phosphoglycolate phosphatase